MPQVPVKSEPEIQERITPGAAISVPAPIEAFGGGEALTGAFRELSGLIGVGQKVLEEQQRNADQLRVLKADSEYRKEAVKHQIQAETQVGENALDLVDRVQVGFGKIGDEIENGLANKRQRDAFARLRIGVETNLYERVLLHSDRERRNLDEAITRDNLESAIDLAVRNYEDPQAVAVAMEHLKFVLKDQGARLRLPDIAVERSTKETISGAHVAILKRMLDNQEDLQAKEYFEAFKDEISATHLGKIEGAVKEGSIRGESLRITDQIMRGELGEVTTIQTPEGPVITKIARELPDLKEALKKASTVKDPEVHDAVVSRIKQRFSELNAIKDQGDAQQYEELTTLIDRNPTKDPRLLIAPDVWFALPAKIRDALMARREIPTNDDRAWHEFTGLDYPQISALTEREYDIRFWSRFDGLHKTQADEIRTRALAAQRREEGADRKFTELVSPARVVESELKERGILPEVGTPDDTQAAFFRRTLEGLGSFIKEFEKQKKAPATNEEIRDILRKQLARKVRISSSFGFDFLSADPEKQFFELPALTKKQKQLAYVPVADIPPPVREAIVAELRSLGRKVTDDKIERLWGARSIEDSEMVERILSEVP